MDAEGSAAHPRPGDDTGETLSERAARPHWCSVVAWIIGLIGFVFWPLLGALGLLFGGLGLARDRSRSGRVQAFLGLALGVLCTVIMVMTAWDLI